MAKTKQGQHRLDSKFHRPLAIAVVTALPVAIAAAGAGVANADPVTPAVPFPVVLNDVAYQAPAVRNAPGIRPIPEAGLLGPIMGLHAPTPVAPVAPIAAPPGKIRIGDLQVDTPSVLDAPTTKQINDTAAGMEAQLATAGDSIGLSPQRSDRLAASTLGDTAIGAGIAMGTVGFPFAAVGGLVGGLAGLIAGVPFLPGGLVVLPVVGAAIGAAVTAAPFAAVGGGIGAVVGAGTALAQP
ncbi:hypothetical protein FOS14_09240 [Skermania sp. ID1734]|uniref:hypothetical protein n=1 Tax=Skermania sp. ID1734 TaxID=2597516 RepID=UPI001180FE55|nr:hypothetical protein [Skermania sp. ID1734]TSE00001.1 hypothetical protein FOS14_09240 [Skermania sp. ID1734]